MEVVYAFAFDGAEWEDFVIYLTKEEAIDKSKKFPSVRLEVFEKSSDGYRPAFAYYLNGNLLDGSHEQV